MTQANVSQTKNSGCLTTIGLFVAGWVLSCFSPKFYAEAMQRRARSAIGFFVMFTFLLSLIQSLVVAGYLFINTGQAINEIFNSYASGQAPVVTITNGVAEVSGIQPRIFADEQRTFVAFDTSGTILTIDRLSFFILLPIWAIALFLAFRHRAPVLNSAHGVA